MPQLFVPIIINDEIGKAPHNGLFSVTGKTMENHPESNSVINEYDETDSDFIFVLDKKLKNRFPSESFSFNVYEYGKNPKDGVLENFTENTTSISLGILCSAYVIKEEHKLKEKYDSITVTGNFNVIDGRISLSEVTDIEEKYKAVQDYASKNTDKKHLFVYISSEETIPDGIQENNVHVIRYDRTFPAECVFAEIFEDKNIDRDAASFQKNRNEFIETRTFIKLKKDFVKNKSCNCCIIKGESNTGKSIAADALCRYLVNSQIISNYTWFYIGDNAKFIDMLSKEKERMASRSIGIAPLGSHKEENCIKETYPEVFDTFDSLLQAGGRCAIIIDNIEYDIVDDVLSFFNRNYPMGSKKYDLILTSWKGSRSNQAASFINSWTIDISDIALDFKELKAIADGVIRINDYSKRYYESSENEQNELLELLFQLCNKYTGYIPTVLSALHKNSIGEVLEKYRKEKHLPIDRRILKITFAQIDFLSKMVLFAYLQIKNFDDALKENEIIDILKKKIFNNASFIDKNDIRIPINILQWWYPLLKENDTGHYEIKKAYLNYAVFSEDLPNELSMARDLIISPKRKVEYAIEEKKFDEFTLYTDKITEKETLNKILIKLCKSDSPLQFFQFLLTKDVDPNYLYDNENPLQICAQKSNDIRIIESLINRRADWTKCQHGKPLLLCASANINSTMLKYVIEHRYYKNINETDYEGLTALHVACFRSRDTKIIELLLKKGASKEKRSCGGRTLLHWAVRNTDSTMLRYVLEHGFCKNINETDYEGLTALHLACFYSVDTKPIELLIEKGANKDARTKDGWTVLHFAADNKNFSVLKYILEHHYFSNIDEVDNYGQTALHHVCLRGKNIKSIEILKMHGANMEARPKDRGAALHYAAANEDSTILIYILNHNYYGNINETVNGGRTALHLACAHSKDSKSIDLLIAKGADKEAKSNRGRSMLHYAAQNNDSTVLRYILEHHYYSDINEADNYGYTALHLVHTSSSIKLLLEYGANKNPKSNNGMTPLHCVAQDNDITVLQYILEHHYYSDINEADNDGYTALHQACRFSKNINSINLLLEYGANKDSKSYDGNMLLHCAARNKYIPMLRYILEHNYYSDINEADNDGETALFHAQTLESSKLLLEHGADPKIVTPKGNNILHAAVLKDNAEIVEYIMKNLPMVNPLLKNADGKTPADLAKSDDIKKLFKK